MNREVSIEWLKAAKLDLDAAEKLKRHQHLAAITAYHTQQAVEKCLKSLFEFKDLNVPKKHDLISLYRGLTSYKLNLDENILDKLSELYIDARYPGDLGLLPYGIPEKEDVDVFYNFASSLYNEIMKIVSVD